MESQIESIQEQFIVYMSAGIRQDHHSSTTAVSRRRATMPAFVFVRLTTLILISRSSTEQVE